MPEDYDPERGGVFWHSQQSSASYALSRPRISRGRTRPTWQLESSRRMMPGLRSTAVR